MGKNIAPFDISKALKKGFIYLLIAVPFMLAVSVLLNIAKAPYWLNLMSVVVVGGAVVLVCFSISSKRAETKKMKKEEHGKFDPFKD